MDSSHEILSFLYFYFIYPLSLIFCLTLDFDPFAEDEVDEEAEKIKAERVAAYNAKKEKSMPLYPF